MRSLVGRDQMRQKRQGGRTPTLETSERGSLSEVGSTIHANQTQFGNLSQWNRSKQPLNNEETGRISTMKKKN